MTALTIILGAGSAALALGFIVYGIPYIARRLSVRGLVRRCNGERALAITFDDGPGPRLTPRVIGVLEEHGAIATFFPLGERAEAHPELLPAVVAAGHEIGCHGQSHPHAFRVGPIAALRDARRGLIALSAWLTRPTIFRPPFGKLDLITWIYLRRNGVKLGWWTVDSGDTRGQVSSRPLLEAVRDSRGGVVLFHDFDRVSGRDAHVLKMLEELLDLARDEGIRVVRLSEILD